MRERRLGTFRTISSQLNLLPSEKRVGDATRPVFRITLDVQKRLDSSDFSPWRRCTVTAVQAPYIRTAMNCPLSAQDAGKGARSEWEQKYPGQKPGTCRAPEPQVQNQSTDVVHAARAFCLATNVVLAAGHPLPAPFKFCRVINAAVIRAL